MQSQRTVDSRSAHIGPENHCATFTRSHADLHHIYLAIGLSGLVTTDCNSAHLHEKGRRCKHHLRPCQEDVAFGIDGTQPRCAWRRIHVPDMRVVASFPKLGLVAACAIQGCWLLVKLTVQELRVTGVRAVYPSPRAVVLLPKQLSGATGRCRLAAHPFSSVVAPTIAPLMS